MEYKSIAVREAVKRRQEEITKIVQLDLVVSELEALPEMKGQLVQISSAGVTLYPMQMPIEAVYEFAGKVKAIVESTVIEPGMVKWTRQEWGQFKSVDLIWFRKSDNYPFRISTKPTNCEWVPVAKTITAYELRCPGAQDG